MNDEEKKMNKDEKCTCCRLHEADRTITESPIHPGEPLENPLCRSCWDGVMDLTRRRLSRQRSGTV